MTEAQAYGSVFGALMFFGYAFICWKTGRFYGGTNNLKQSKVTSKAITKEKNPKEFKYGIIILLIAGTFFIIAPLLIKIGLLPNFFED